MEDEEAFPDCEVCYGESGRERKSEGSAICRFDGCVREYKRRRAARRDSGTARGIGRSQIDFTLSKPPPISQISFQIFLLIVNYG